MEWISVKDRLPEIGVNVVAANIEYGQIDCFVGSLFSSGWIPSTSCLEAHNYDGGASIDIERHIIVTHWMELPQPPK